MSSRHCPTDSELEHLIGRAAALPDAPKDWVTRAVGQFGQRRPDGASMVKALVNRFVAVLQFDSWAPTALPLAVRSMPSQTRHLLFSMQGRDIDLRITPAAEAYALAGQILGPDDAGSVELSRDTADTTLQDPLHTVRLDELGEFRLDGVPRGTYRLTLRVGRDEIALPPIAVGDRPG